MKNKVVMFPLALLLVPILVLFLYRFLPYDTVRFIWYYVILYIGMFSGIYALYHFRNLRKDKFSNMQKAVIILFILFFITCVVSTILSKMPMLSLLGSDYRREGLFTYISYFLLAFSCMFLNSKEKKSIYQMLVIIGMILTIFTLFKITPFLSPYQYSYNGIFYQFNHFSYFLILALVCNTGLFVTANEKIEKIVYYVSYVFLLIQLIVNNTFGGYLALLVTTIMMLVYYIKVKKIKGNSLILLFTFLLLSCCISNEKGIIVYNNIFDNAKEVISTDFSKEEELYKLGTTRGRLWVEAIKMIQKRPLIGYGIEGLQEEYIKIGMPYADKPHNIILALSGYVGIPGMVCFLSAIGIVMYSILRKIKELELEDIIAFFACICFLGSSIFANSMFYTTPYVCIFMGILLGIFYQNHLKQLTKNNKVVKSDYKDVD